MDKYNTTGHNLLYTNDEMDQVVTCKYCGRSTIYGELTWLNGKCMCPACYLNERAKEDVR